MKCEGIVSKEDFDISYFSELSDRPRELTYQCCPFALEINNGMVVGNTVMNYKGEEFSFLKDATDPLFKKYPGPVMMEKYSGEFSKEDLIYIPGTVYTTFCMPLSYSHWMHDYLPLTKLIKIREKNNQDYKLRLKIDEDVVASRSSYKREDKSYFVEETLKFSGMNMNNIISYKSFTNFTADKIVFLWSGDRRAAWIRKFLREDVFNKVRNPEIVPTENIYISRQDTVKLRGNMEDELEIEEKLSSKYGYKIYHLNQKTFTQQVEIFQKAKNVIAQHGSAMMDTFACQEGTKVLQIWPSWVSYLYVGPEFIPCYPEFVDLKNLVCKGCEKRWRVFKVNWDRLEEKIIKYKMY